MFSPLLDSHAEAPLGGSPAPDEAAEAEKAAALMAEAQKAEAAAKAEAARKIAASVVADRAAAAARREREDLAKTPRPVAVVAPPAIIAKRSMSRSMLLTIAAVAIMGVVAVAQRDFILGQFRSGRSAVEGQAAQLDAAAIAASLRAPLPDISSNKPSPVAAAQPHTSKPAVKAPDKVDSSNRPVKAESVPVTVTAPPVPEAPAPAAAERPRSAESTQPTGKFFEPNDVDVSPVVAKRIEPQLPLGLKARANDVVIVRVLVSQTGDPSRVSLLRKSKQGRLLDDAVVAAVTQWRFSPAMKRGEAVSSWYNIGVPLGQTN